MSKAPTVIAITGASSGIGAAVAQYYAAPGRTLALIGRHVERLEQATGFQVKPGLAVRSDTAGPIVSGVTAAGDRVPIVIENVSFNQRVGTVTYLHAITVS